MLVKIFGVIPLCILYIYIVKTYCAEHGLVASMLLVSMLAITRKKHFQPIMWICLAGHVIAIKYKSDIAAHTCFAIAVIASLFFQKSTPLRKKPENSPTKTGTPTKTSTPSPSMQDPSMQESSTPQKSIAATTPPVSIASSTPPVSIKASTPQQSPTSNVSNVSTPIYDQGKQSPLVLRKSLSQPSTPLSSASDRILRTPLSAASKYESDDVIVEEGAETKMSLKAQSTAIIAKAREEARKAALERMEQKKIRDWRKSISPSDDCI